MSTWISPSFDDRKLENPSVEELIDVFEDRVQFWLLNPAKTLLGASHGFVPAVALLVTYFEGIEIYRKGQDSVGKSKTFFRDAFLDVFANSGVRRGLLAQAADLLYEDARCGFFHDGIFRGRVLFAPGRKGALEVTVPRINGQPDDKGPILSVLIEPWLLLAEIERHFTNYVRALRNVGNQALRDAFVKAVEVKWRLHEPGAIVDLEEGEFRSSHG